jgi:mono/diheme cytochrome c family protein
MIVRYRLTAVLWILLLNCSWAIDPPAEIRWNFGAEETTSLEASEDVHRDVPGPRPPDYPDFDSGNTAVKLDGKGARLSVADSGPQSPFDFTVGDAITLEAWVQVDDIRSGENLYVICKGRTGAQGFAAENQNWALRVAERDGKAGLGFLFASSPESASAKSGAPWHRWTSDSGFKPGRNWHHIAITYKFGDATSLRGWIDGKLQTGKWDMGGATSDAPFVDDDAVWIGSAQSGAASSSFRGSLDSIAIHRQILDDATLKSRFNFTGKEIVDRPLAEVMPDMGTLEPGVVSAVLLEGMPVHNRWLNEGENLPVEILRWQPEAFLLDRLPLRHDAAGVRESWKAPVLLRMAADVKLSPGHHRFLMRVRGLSRLWVDGKVIARAEPSKGSPSGEEPMTPLAKPPVPGARIAEHRQQEVFGDARVGESGVCRIVLETLVGGKDFRTDPGELCVAMKKSDGSAFLILPQTDPENNPLLLTDASVDALLKRTEQSLAQLDDLNRRTAAATQDAFWKSRHEVARDWAKNNPAPQVPPMTDVALGAEANPIDAFLADKVQKALAESAKNPVTESREFHKSVLPILKEQCSRCHGDKENGGLRLDSRDAVMKAGDSGVAAIVPGDLSASELVRRIRAENPEERMPPGEAALTEDQIKTLESWITSGAAWPAPPVTAEDVAAAPLITDADFLRRAFLDTVGVPPTEQDAREFLHDEAGDKRTKLVDRLLSDERFADHWVSYWQDVLAENPTLVNSSLNTTGPFRWFLYDSLRDNKSFDRMVTELIQLRGSAHEGGSAGFGIAGDNDAPYAAKGQIVANAFLGIELQCARCHDSPYHSTKQSDLYSLAAMFEQKPVSVPKTSRVPVAFFEKKTRESLIKVSLNPDATLEPKWPFAETCGSLDDDTLNSLLQSPKNSRERLAALITSPQNRRFAPLVVNRLWRRLFGAGFVEPAHDWEGHPASHPELLEWLAHEFVSHDYDQRHLIRLMMTSQLYQRAATGKNISASPELRFFSAPDRRRLTAEQIVDSLHAAGGQEMDVEEFTFDPDARRPASNRLTLGVPDRAWMFASLANERDRPTLGLPKARAIADILEAFGWSGSRQSPRTDRETSSNVLQPGVLANSTASVLLTRATRNSGLAVLAIEARTPEELVDSLFLRYLSRYPAPAERAAIANALSAGFESRVLASGIEPLPPAPEALPKVTWSNHLRSEANHVALEMERRARDGQPADPRLSSEWREIYEDTVWSLINIREFVWMP